MVYVRKPVHCLEIGYCYDIRWKSKNVEKNILYVTFQDKEEYSLTLLLTTNEIVFEKEFNHYEILRELKSFCIISKKDSIINIYYRNTITSIDGRLWSFHGDTTLIAQRLNQYFPKLSGASKDRLGLLLNFANYELSMDRIGTTIVYHDENKKTFPLESVKNAETISLFIHDEQTLKSKKLKLSKSDTKPITP